MASTKRIPIDQLKVGMFIAGMDQPWYRTPFLLHKWLLTNPEDIVQLKRHGIREVTIDMDRGLDVGVSASLATSEASPSAEPPSASPQTDVSPPDPQGQPGGTAAVAYREALDSMERIFRDLEAGQPPKIATLRSIVSDLLQQIVAQPESMMLQICLDKMRRFDKTLSSHGMEVCVLALIVAVEHGSEETDREAIGIGALLHDIGYVRLPRNLYRKATPLTEQEKTLASQHPQLAATVLAQADPFPEAVTRIIAQHHEYLDGSGFPKRLKGGAISPLAQLVGLVDFYNELVGMEHGRPPLLPHDAIRQLYLLGEKGHFDKKLVEVAIKALGVYPIGSLIKLNTSECGVVIGLNHDDRLRPRIRIISSPTGDLLSEAIDVNLGDTAADQPTRTILRALDPNHEHVDLPRYFETAIGGLSR